MAIASCRQISRSTSALNVCYAPTTVSVSIASFAQIVSQTTIVTMASVLTVLNGTTIFVRDAATASRWKNYARLAASARTAGSIASMASARKTYRLADMVKENEPKHRLQSTSSAVSAITASMGTPTATPVSFA